MPRISPDFISAEADIHPVRWRRRRRRLHGDQVARGPQPRRVPPLRASVFPIITLVATRTIGTLVIFER